MEREDTWYEFTSNMRVGHERGGDKDAETLYRQLGRLIETTPDFSGFVPITHEQFVWIGRAHALVLASNDLAWRAEFDLAAKGYKAPRARTR